MEIRRELEETLTGVVKEHGLSQRLVMSLGSMTRLLRNRNLIDHHTSALLDDLRVLGNAAAHGSNETEFTKEDAFRYRKLADEARVKDVARLARSGSDRCS